MDKELKFYTFHNIGSEESPVYLLDLTVRDAVVINPALSIIPDDGVEADTSLPVCGDDEVLIIECDELKALTVSKNVKAVKDHRDIPVWLKASGHPRFWDQILLDDAFTTLDPPFEFSKWQDHGWVEDTDRKNAHAEQAAENTFNECMLEASEAIAPLQDAVDIGIASELENSILITWKKYRVELNRVKQQEGWPLNVVWPEQPK